MTRHLLLGVSTVMVLAGVAGLRGQVPVPIPGTNSTAFTKVAFNCDDNGSQYSLVNETICYTLTARNLTNSTLFINISDPLLGELQCSPEMTVNLPPLSAQVPSNGTMVCTGEYLVTQADLDTGFINNSATALSNATIVSQSNATVFAVQNPGLSLTKTTTSLGYSQAGQVIPYTMVATNTGNVTLANVTITDPLLPSLTCTPAQPVASLAPGGTLTCTGSYVVQPTDLTNGSITNTATATAEFDTFDPIIILSPPGDETAQAEGPGGIGTLALVQVTAQSTVTVPGLAPGVSNTRLALTACTLELQQDWTPRFTKLQFEVWNEDEIKFTGAFECADSWHETDFGQDFDAAQQNFTIAVLGTYSARYRVQAVTSTQCPGAQATGLLGVQSMFLENRHMAGSNLAGAGKFVGSIRWDPQGPVPEGGIR